MPLSKNEIAEFILSTFHGVEQRSTWGETAFFYNPGQELAHGVYFIT